MKNSQKILTAGVIIVIAVIAAVGVMDMVTKQTAPQSGSTPPAQAWKTYKNLGIEFQYPDSKAWGEPQETIAKGGRFSIYFQTSTSTNAFFVSPFVYADIANGLQTFDQLVINSTWNRDHTGPDPSYTVKDITVNGIHGKEIIRPYTLAQGTSETSFEALIPLDDKTAITFDGDSTLLTEDTFDTIVGSFRVDGGSRVQTDQTTGWAIYQNSGMTFEYPQKFDTDYASYSLQIRAINRHDASAISGGCYPEHSGKGTVDTGETVLINGVQFCLTEGNDVGAGQSYNYYTYTTLRGEYYRVITYAVHTSNGCGVYKNSDDTNAPGNERYRQCMDFQAHYDELVLQPIQESIGTISFSGSDTGTETPPPGPAPYLNVQNTNEQTGLTVISSPKFGDAYTFGDTIRIKWNPELIDVSTVRLVSVDDAGFIPMQIYQRIALGDDVSRSAEFDYMIPDNLTVYPGKYQVKLLQYGGVDGYTSDVFTISSPVQLLKRADKPFDIVSILGARSSYAAGEVMKLNVEAENGDGTPADQVKGFNVQARLLDVDNQGVWSGNATYDPNAKVWHLDIPVSEGTYRVQVSLYCGLEKLDSVCGQEYGYDHQVDKYVNFAM